MKESDSYFLIEAGNYEDNPLEFYFADGTMQTMSSLQASKNTAAYLQSQSIRAKFFEFVGGHNYVCWRASLPQRLVDVYRVRKK